MKKYGFTLAELMIALGIIAVAAVIAAPAISDMMPQKDKLKVIKYATIIDNATNELLNDKSLYHTTTYTGLTVDEYGNMNLAQDFDRSKVGTQLCIGLECAHTPDNFTGSAMQKLKYTGTGKYKNLLSDKLGLKNGVHPDGSKWTIETGIPAKISIDIDGDKNGKNCHYPISLFDNTGCSEKPDTFLFEVDKNGTVVGDDPLTRAYLANPLNMHDKKKDFYTASQSLNNKIHPPKK